MGLKVCSLSSGSKGNSILIYSESTQILVDAGISAKKVLEGLTALKLAPQLDALLITHSHYDHIRYCNEIKEAFSAEVYAHRLTAEDMPSVKVNAFDFHDFYIRDITVSPFKLSHDVFCVGYNFFRCGSKVSVATDTGVIDDETLLRLEGSESAVIEANHDKNLLMSNPHYSLTLKRRILSDRGHLSNDASAEIAAFLVRTGTKNIMLAHLSEENNYPELALDTVGKRLKAERLSAFVTVALQHKMSDIIGE